MNWYRRAQEISENKGTLEFTVSKDDFTAFRKRDFLGDTVPSAILRAIKNHDGAIFRVPYVARTEDGETMGITFECPQGMLPAMFEFLEPQIRERIDVAIRGSRVVNPVGEKFMKRMESSFPYTFRKDWFGDTSEYKGQEGDELASMDGQVYTINFMADYYPHGVYNIRAYRPEGIPEWIWSSIYRDVQEKARPHAFRKLDKVRYDQDPLNRIIDGMEEEQQ